MDTPLFQSLMNPGPAPAGPQRTFAPPSTPQMWQQQVNQAVSGNQQALAQQNNAITQSQGMRFGAPGRAARAQQNQNAMLAAIGNQQARVNIPMQGMQQYSQYTQDYDRGAEEAFQARQREAIQRQQIGAGMLNPLLSALVGFAG